MSVEIINADVMDGLGRLDDNSVDMCFTSPPYWGLRDYGFDGQIGMEESWAEHVDIMLKVFREVRRVLKPEGTLWLNYGDCYASSPNGRSAADIKELASDDRGFVDKPFSTVGGVFKPKDLLMMPARLAIAFQEDGWWLRSENIWAKPNPMPESVKDRPATSHEKIYLLSKSARYHYDADAVRMPSSPESAARYERGRSDSHKWADGGPGNQTIAKSFDHMRKPVSGWATGDGAHTALAHNKGVRGRDTYGRHTLEDALPQSEQRSDRKYGDDSNGDFRRHNASNEKSTLGVSASVPQDKQSGHGRRQDGFNERWNEKVRGSTPRHEGHIQHTRLEQTGRGMGRNLRNYEPYFPEVWNIATAPFKDAHFATFPTALVTPGILAGCPLGGTVLDPFGGSGTVGLVADRLQRNAILIEGNPEYAEMARDRINADGVLFPAAEVAQ